MFASASHRCVQITPTSIQNTHKLCAIAITALARFPNMHTQQHAHTHHHVNKAFTGAQRDMPFRHIRAESQRSEFDVHIVRHSGHSEPGERKYTPTDSAYLEICINYTAAKYSECSRHDMMSWENEPRVCRRFRCRLTC